MFKRRTVRTSYKSRTKGGNKTRTSTRRGLTTEEMKHDVDIKNINRGMRKDKYDHERDIATEITKRKQTKYRASAGTVVGASATQDVDEIADGGIAPREPSPAPQPTVEPNPQPQPKPQPKPKPTVVIDDGE